MRQNCGGFAALDFRLRAPIPLQARRVHRASNAIPSGSETPVASRNGSRRDNSVSEPRGFRIPASLRHSVLPHDGPPLGIEFGLGDELGIEEILQVGQLLLQALGRSRRGGGSVAGGVAAAARLGPGDSVAWCAAFAGTMLSGAGAKGLVSFSADSYRTEWVAKTGAIALPTNDPTTWRKNDLVVMLTPSKTGGSVQHHVAFIRGVDIQTQRVRLCGGNQSDNLNEGNWAAGSLRNVGFVGRQWAIPAEFDQPILGKLTTGGVVKTR